MNISMSRVMMALDCAQLSVLSKTLNNSRYWARQSFHNIKREFKNGNPSLSVWPSIACFKESDIQTNDFYTELQVGSSSLNCPDEKVE